MPLMLTQEVYPASRARQFQILALLEAAGHGIGVERAPTSFNTPTGYGLILRQRLAERTVEAALHPPILKTCERERGCRERHQG
jgi:hypothetical protein